MNQRDLSLASYDDVMAEIDRLQRGGYEQTGQWNLGQICKHLAYYFRGSLDGFDFLLPWLIRKLIGRPLFKRVLRTQRIPSGNRTLPKSVPPADVDEQAAVAEARELLERLKNARDGLHPSPLFDHLTCDEWRTLHMIHCAHHLKHLIPKNA